MTTPPTEEHAKDQERPGPLSGVRVLDLSRVLAGPVCGSLLADLGADVIKIEMPGTGDDSRSFTPLLAGESSYFMLVNRGKRSITLDLKSDAGRGVLLDLIEQSDVLVENFRPGVTARLGIDAETVLARRPELVYVSISGFGQTGPFSRRPAYDHVVQAMAGIMSVTGWPDEQPTRVGDAVADVVAGLYGAWAALAALMQRDRTGRGQHVDVAMLDTMLSLQAVSLSQVLGGAGVPERIGNAHPISAPMDSYPATDGHVVIAVANDALFSRFCRALGRPELVTDPQFATDSDRRAHQVQLRSVIEGWTSVRTVDDVVADLDLAGVPAAPIWGVVDLLGSEHATARGLVSTVQHPVAGEVSTVGQPVRFSDLDTEPRRAPMLGEHTREVLVELGLTDAQVEQLRAEGVVS